MKNIGFGRCSRSLIAVLALCAFVTTAKAESKTAVPMVIVISMDGVRHDYPDKGSLPGFKRMEREGLRSTLIPTFPSNTFPGHISLATGAPPSVHGIIDNKMYDTRMKKNFETEAIAEWLEAEPLWLAVERQGLKAATFYWLGSEYPWKGETHSYTKTPFKRVRSEAVKLRQIEEWMDLPLDARPSLIMAYWHGADSVGHALGPDDPKVLSQLKRQDHYLQELQALVDKRKAWDRTTLILVSDHGMTNKTKPLDLYAMFSEAGIDPYLKKSAAIAHLNFKNKQNFKKAYDYFQRHPHVSPYYPKSMPEGLEVFFPNRSGELVLLAKDGFRFSARGFYDFAQALLPSTGGIHGLNPRHPDMGAIFFAMGRGIKPGQRLAEVSMLDVAPSVTSLLGLEPPLDSTGISVLPTTK